MDLRSSRRDVILRGGGAVAAVCLPGLAGCARGGDFGGATMGTTYTVKVSNPLSGSALRALEARVEDILETVNAQMSTYRPDSELSRFNASSPKQWHAVSDDTAEVVQDAIHMGSLSGGAFDVTAGELVHRWGFGAPLHRGYEAEDSCDIPRHRRLLVRRSSAALWKSCRSVLVDLSGIAKGFAVDRIGAHLEEIGIADYLIEIGGELRVRGRNPRGGPWRIGIEQPDAGRVAPQAVVGLEDGALATSGDYRDYYEIAGRRYSHIIDPRKGAPVTDRLASVSVIANSTMVADALSTALMVMGPDLGMRMARGLRLAALFVVRVDGGLAELTTPKFDRYRVAEEVST